MYIDMTNVSSSEVETFANQKQDRLETFVITFTKDDFPEETQAKYVISRVVNSTITSGYIISEPSAIFSASNDSQDLSSMINLKLTACDRIEGQLKYSLTFESTYKLDDGEIKANIIIF